MLAEDLSKSVVDYLNDNILGFHSTSSGEVVTLPRCVVEVVEDGEEVIGYCSRLNVTATLYVEAASESALADLDSGTRDLELAFSPTLFRQGCSDGNIVVDGVLAGPSTSELDGDTWKRSKTLTAFCRG